MALGAEGGVATRLIRGWALLLGGGGQAGCLVSGLCVRLKILAVTAQARPGTG